MIIIILTQEVITLDKGMVSIAVLSFLLQVKVEIRYNLSKGSDILQMEPDMV